MGPFWPVQDILTAKTPGHYKEVKKAPLKVLV
jgi:hypothetical protein